MATNKLSMSVTVADLPQVKAMAARLAEAGEIASVMQELIEDDGAFATCPWCAADDARRDQMPSGAFHFDEGCLLLELLDLLSPAPDTEGRGRA